MNESLSLRRNGWPGSLRKKSGAEQSRSTRTRRGLTAPRGTGRQELGLLSIWRD
jgi:hypothetical protein